MDRLAERILNIIQKQGSIYRWEISYRLRHHSETEIELALAELLACNNIVRLEPIGLVHQNERLIVYIPNP